MQKNPAGILNGSRPGRVSLGTKLANGLLAGIVPPCRPWPMAGASCSAGRASAGTTPAARRAESLSGCSFRPVPRVATPAARRAERSAGCRREAFRRLRPVRDFMQRICMRRRRQGSAVHTFRIVPDARPGHCAERLRSIRSGRRQAASGSGAVGICMCRQV